MIKKILGLSAVAVLVAACASSNDQAINDTNAAASAYNEQSNAALPAQTGTAAAVTTGTTTETATAMAATSNSGKSYTVVAGDSLWKIARKNGVTVNALKKANNLTDDMIRPGQVLVIP